MEIRSNKVMRTFISVLKEKYYDGKIEKDNWIELQPILKTLRQLHPDVKYITAFDIKHFITTDCKRRLEISKDLKHVKILRGV